MAQVTPAVGAVVRFWGEPDAWRWKVLKTDDHGCLFCHRLDDPTVAGPRHRNGIRDERGCDKTPTKRRV